MKDLFKNTFNEFLKEQKSNPKLRIPDPKEPSSYKLKAYHATNLDNISSILKKGLIPGFSKPSGQTWLGTYSGRAIYYHLSFPFHEVYNGADWDSGLAFAGVLEVKLDAPAELIVPDEEAGSKEDTPKIIRSKLALAIAMKVPTSKIKAVHLPDLPEAREFGSKIKRVKVKYYNQKSLGY